MTTTADATARKKNNGKAWAANGAAVVPLAARVAGRTLLAGAGSCRDFSHLAITLCRALGVPARLVAVYAPGLSPMDFHAVVEADVDGTWCVVDPTRLAPTSSLVRICSGRDAADTAFLSLFGGRARFETMSVTATTAGARHAVEDLERRGLLVESDGALCVFPAGFTTREGNPLPLIVRKSDGGFNYTTTDLATLEYRLATWHPDEIVYVTDGRQQLRDGRSRLAVRPSCNNLFKACTGRRPRHRSSTFRSAARRSGPGSAAFW